MPWLKKAGTRRAEVRRNRPDTAVKQMRALWEEGRLANAWVAVVFAAGAIAILCLHEQVMPYRAGQWTPNDIVARVDFHWRDQSRLDAARQRRREAEPRIYRPASVDVWSVIQQKLTELPDRIVGGNPDEVPADLKPLAGAAATKLVAYRDKAERAAYQRMVDGYIEGIRGLKLVILTDAERREDAGKSIRLTDVGLQAADATFGLGMRTELAAALRPRAAEMFPLVLQAPLTELTLAWLSPTYEYSEALTIDARNRAEQLVAPNEGEVAFRKNEPIVRAGEIRQRDVQILQAENTEFVRTLGSRVWRERLGLAVIVLVVTIAMAGYTARFQPRIVRKTARAVAVVGLMLPMLLLAQLAGVGGDPVYCFGLAPTLLTAMILSIAYEGRFAAGLASGHAILVTLGLGQSFEFFVILESGVLTCCYMLDDLRTRSRLIEVGGTAALVMIGATAASGLLGYDPLPFVAQNCLYAGAAGLAVGFVVLGILPFIEKMFRITTSMTLLELADVSQPLLRRLALEAPGTYNHSYQVATLAEEAAESIGCNGLLCRVASYYHDVGKIHKADYFVENQCGGENRHLNLSPSVSLLIIVGHVKDGVELAREYNLPTSIIPFIQQHHGTTLVEFFYRQAMSRQEQAGDENEAAVAEMQYRYPGPKPRTKEIAIVMLSDAAESACRAMTDAAPARIEAIVHELAMKRLLDGQFDECDLTLRDLEQVERSLIKTLLGIFHGRIAYPSGTVISGVTPELAAAAAGRLSAVSSSAQESEEDNQGGGDQGPAVRIA